MAITTYTELQTAVGNWLARSDLSSRIPEFISLFEGKFDLSMRTTWQECRNTSFSIAAEYVSVPSDFLELRSATLNTSPRQPMIFLPDDAQGAAFDALGQPRYLSVSGYVTTQDGSRAFRFAPVPDATYTATIVYYAALPKLGASQTTNWLLTKFPHVYMYGALLEAAGYIQDDQRVPMWAQAYNEALVGLKRSGDKSRWGVNGMTVRVG